MRKFGVEAEDFYSAWSSAVKGIAERISPDQRQYPGVKIKMRKRDISNSFSRAPLHPDMINLRCPQFEKDAIELDGNITVGWPGMPFGFPDPIDHISYLY